MLNKYNITWGHPALYTSKYFIRYDDRPPVSIEHGKVLYQKDAGSDSLTIKC